MQTALVKDFGGEPAQKIVVRRLRSSQATLKP